MKLYHLSVPDAMKGHKFTDDVAICYADSKEEATKTFSQLYSYDNLENYVHEVEFNKWNIAILTSY